MSLEINQANCLLTKFGSPLHQRTSPRLTQICVNNKQFRDLYASLYTSESPNNETQYEHFFSSLDIPSFNSEVASSLDAPFTINKLRSALMSMQNGKCPGPEGFPVNFLKTFSDALSPLLLKMFNESLQNGLLPHTIRQATISLKSKKDKDPLSCGNHRSISLQMSNY